MGAVRPERYVVISADGHAGADIEGYRPYLEQRWFSEFDEWAATFVDPWAQLEENEFKIGVASADSSLNWDSTRRQQLLESEGILAEVLFPNTAPPFFPGGVFTVSAPTTRDDYERRWAGLRAHNRWLVDFCDDVPGRRAGVAQVFLNDLDDTVAELYWLKEAGLTGGILLPGDGPGSLVPLHHPSLDAVWQVCAELDIPVHRHANIPCDPVTPEHGFGSAAVGLVEASFFAHRGLSHLVFSGVFDRFPQLKFVLTEGGSGWIPSHLAELDAVYEAAKMRGSIPAAFAGPASEHLARKPSEYWATNCWVGASFMSPGEAQLRHEIGVDRIMWGSDLPHAEGTYPYSLQALQYAFSSADPDEVRVMLSEAAATVYGFDLAALQEAADTIGPTVGEVATPLTDLPRFPEDTVTPALAPMPLPSRGVVGPAV